MMPDPTPEDLFARAFEDPKHEPFDFPGAAGGALLVHGFPGTPNDMRGLAAALNEQGWEARGILLPGFGADIAALPQQRMEDWANAARAALNDLKSRHRRTLLAGHSMGGGLSLQVAADLQPDGLALLAPFWKIDHWLWSLLPVLRFPVRKLRVFSLRGLDFSAPETRRGLSSFLPGLDLDDPQVQEAVRQFALPTSVLNQVRRVGRAGHQRAPEIRSRTLVLQGSQDDLVTPLLTRRLAGALPTAPRYVEVADGHLINDDQKPGWPIVQRELLELAAALLTSPEPAGR